MKSPRERGAQCLSAPGWPTSGHLDIGFNQLLLLPRPHFHFLASDPRAHASPRLRHRKSHITLQGKVTGTSPACSAPCRAVQTAA